MPSERDRDFVACFLYSRAQMCLCQTPGRRRLLITGRFVNTVCGPALEAISIRATVVCVPLLLCAGWRQHNDCCAFVAVESGQHPFPGLGSKDASLLYVANEIVVSTLVMVPRWRLCQYPSLCCCLLAVDGSLSCSPAIYYCTI